MNLSTHLIESDLQGLDIEGPERIEKHLKILKKKKMIRQVFTEFYDLSAALDQEFFGNTPGRRVELGSGVSFFKSRYPDVLLTDIKPATNLDAVVDAQQLPFKPKSIRSIFGMNCFHHFSDPHAFFKDIDAGLASGGGCVLIEPFFGPFSAFIHRQLFFSEYFDKTESSWVSNHRKTMQGANQALSYIVFFRDRTKFYRLYPNFEIVHTRPIPTYFRYLFSGGLNFRQLVPSSMIGLVRALESALYPFARLIALHHVIVIRKKHSVDS